MTNDFFPRRRGQYKNKFVSPQPNSSWQQPTAFRTPEAVATGEEQQPQTNTVGPLLDQTPKKPKRTLKERLQSLTKKQWIIIGVVAALVVVGGSFALYHFVLKDDPKPAKTTIKKAEAKNETPPPPIYATLTGLPITDASINDRPVIGIMIENSADARPQSGLNQAGVVFEAIAEGGITRFLTLFQDSQPDYIGPVRSVRPYYVQWAMGFDAAVAHVGGSADGLALVRRPPAKDLDQFAGSAYFRRVSNRFAPHNVYTSIAQLNEYASKKGYGKSNYTGFTRKNDTPNPAPNAKSIDFTISSPVFNAHYDYDAATNTYKRSEGGKPHTDEKSGQQLAPKVVVGLVMPQGKNGVYTTYNTIGSGQAFIFQDGVLTNGTWHKPSNTAQFSFKDANGAELALNRGQTWITVVGSPDRVSAKP